MQNPIHQSINDCIQAVAQLQEDRNVEFIERAALLIADCFRAGNKIIIAGNGGSLCDAAHFAEELTGQFRHYRRALPAIALSEPGHLTCVGNDMGFDKVFARGVEAYGQPGDVFIGLTTSGNSKNIITAIERAKELGLATVAFLGKDGGALKGVADLEMLISGFTFSDRIQEAHMAAIHIIIELVEQHLFASEQIEQQCECSAIEQS